jgi:uncharacterized protein YhhL (DUF1145 family)
MINSIAAMKFYFFTILIASLSEFSGFNCLPQENDQVKELVNSIQNDFSTETMEKMNEYYSKMNELKNQNPIVKNPQIDLLTAMLHHVQNTKKCGNNLQTMHVDLQPLWIFKFKDQIIKFQRLANTLNHLISKINDNNEMLQHVTIKNQLIDSDLFTSLSYFIFSKQVSSNPLTQEENEPKRDNNGTRIDEKDKIQVVKSQFDYLSTFGQIFVDESFISTKNNYKNESGKNSAFDSFIIGYGVTLFGDPSTTSTNNKNHILNDKCLFLTKDSTKNGDYIDVDGIKLNKSCESLNYNTGNSYDPSQIMNNLNNNNNYHRNEPEYEQYFDGTPEIDIITNNKYHNCHLWYEKLENAYNKKIDGINNMNDQKNFLLNLNYQNFLRWLLTDNEFSKAQWCGPYYDCTNKYDNSNHNNNKTPEWVLIHSLPLFDGRKRLKGAIALKLKLTKMNINQCENGDPVFSNTHKCKLNSKCIFTPVNQFKSGSYQCECFDGYLSNTHTDGPDTIFQGDVIEKQYWLSKSMANNTYNQDFKCLPCLENECCAMVDFNTHERTLTDKELVQKFKEHQNDFLKNCRNYNMTLRYCILVVQIIFIIITITLAVVIFYSRQTKIIKNSMWILLEIILFGAFLLYSTVVIQHFEPIKATCLAIPWFRELGFTIVYGILNLRLYK